MQLAMKKSFPEITASAATTFFGFIALTFMNFLKLKMTRQVL